MPDFNEMSAHGLLRNIASIKNETDNREDEKEAYEKSKIDKTPGCDRNRSGKKSQALYKTRFTKNDQHNESVDRKSA